MYWDVLEPDVDQKQIVKTGVPLVVVGAAMLLLFFMVGRLVGWRGKPAVPEPVGACHNADGSGGGSGGERAGCGGVGGRGW